MMRPKTTLLLVCFGLFSLILAGCHPKVGDIYAINNSSHSVKLFAHGGDAINPSPEKVLIATIPPGGTQKIKHRLPHRYSSLLYTYTDEKDNKLGAVSCEFQKIQADLESKGYLELIIK